MSIFDETTRRKTGKFGEDYYVLRDNLKKQKNSLKTGPINDGSF